MIDYSTVPLVHAPYYDGYIKAMEGKDVFQVLKKQTEDLRFLISAIPEAEGIFRYADGKWSIKEVLGHIIDSERVFGYRLFCILRGEKVSLPGFDENSYVAHSHFNSRSFDSLIDEFTSLRHATTVGLDPLDFEALARVGTANTFQVSAFALLYILAGHCNHHMTIIRDRYLNR